MNWKAIKQSIREEIKRAEADAKAGFIKVTGLESPAPNSPTKEWHAYWDARRAFDARTGPARRTALYSLQAHLRGRLHMTKRWTVYFNLRDPAVRAAALASNGRALQEWTMEEQRTLIGPLLEEFGITSLEAAA